MIVKYSINGSYCNILYMRLKTELYSKEQDHIIDTIISILGITQENNCITLYEIENFNEIKLQLMGLIPEIRKWFSLAHVNPINNPDNYKRPYLSIIKQLTKKHWNIHSKFSHLKIGTNNIPTQKYSFYKTI